MMRRPLLLVAAVLLGAVSAAACSSMIVSAAASANGRPMIWKNRDTGAEGNFLHRVEAPGRIGYVGLFNDADTLCTDEAWMGVNDAGFAIINTVAYNLAPNDPAWTDREGFVMARALQSCRSVDDFAALLDSLPRPMGLRTCFGVLDAEGRGAYFETDDYRYARYDLSDAKEGVMVRTNYAYSGPTVGIETSRPDNDFRSWGYVRHRDVVDILGPQIATGSLTPASFVGIPADSLALVRFAAGDGYTPADAWGGMCRALYNARTGFDMATSTADTVADEGEMVARRSTMASIVIELPAPGEHSEFSETSEPSEFSESSEFSEFSEAPAPVIWAVLGYPPVAPTFRATLHSIPPEADAVHPTGAHARARSPLCTAATALRDTVITPTPPYRIHLPSLRRAIGGQKD